MASHDAHGPGWRPSARGVMQIAFFHPDYTVGPGIAPDLLTRAHGAPLAGSVDRTLPPVGNRTPP